MVWNFRRDLSPKRAILSFNNELAQNTNQLSRNR